MTRHLVTGASGQDGRLLVDLLVSQGHEVVGCGLEPGALPAGVRWATLDVTDAVAVRRIVADVRPEVVHHLAAVSSVAASWADPGLADAVNRRGALATLEAAQAVDARFVLASSSEVFGPVAGGVADEATPLRPQNPYAEAKAAAHRAVQQARATGAAATNLVLFGHTGPLQPPTFAIPTLCRQAVEVARGQREAVELQDPTIARDWGAASDVAGAFACASVGPPGDYVIATGRLHRLAEVAGWALAAAGVPEPTAGLVHRSGAPRPADVGGVRGDATRARELLGWAPRHSLEAVVAEMVRAILDAG